jgi:hypothetical protein
MQLAESFSQLIDTVTGLNGVRAVGKSGGAALPETAETDIDLFIYCDAIPELSERSRAIEGLGLMNANTQQGGHWGVVDLVLLSGIETYLMYFTLEETIDSVRDILEGKLPDKLDNYFYPTGRLATLREMTVLSDCAGFLVSMKRRLANYPEKLARTLAEYHLGALGDTEDLERAVLRSDVLFYHFALDLALDHFLQALYAVNRRFFPSRKRTFDDLEGFAVKPEDCRERLLKIVRLGASEQRLGRSYALWRRLVRELTALAGRNQ